MAINTTVRISLLSLCLAAQGCTYQAWYSGFQEQQRQQCYKDTINPSDTQRCLERVNNTSYDQYRIQREQAIERSKK